MIDPRKMDYGFILRRYDIESESQMRPESVAARMLPQDPLLGEVASSVMFMRLRDVGPAVSRALQMGVKPLDIINRGLVAGMDAVGYLYKEHVYYLPEVMMAAKTMESGIALAEKHIPGGRVTKGMVVMHAAEGDPHDIGKNIASVMLRSAGYDVVDLGKDVPVDEVVRIVLDRKPLMVTGTALMTTTMPAFPAAAEKLHAAGLDIPYMAAGGAVNREYAESFDGGIYSRKAPQTPPIADMVLKGKSWREIREEWDDITGGV